MCYFIYILKSINYNKTYVGMTSDLERRIKEHNSGKSAFTNKFIPWEIIYTEPVENRMQARTREKYFKSSAGRRKIKLMIENLSPGSSVDRATVS